jgi:phenylpropionate dioxygenase-like ring-hydroxylating dioxygenase large terminal subunit
MNEPLHGLAIAPPEERRVLLPKEAYVSETYAREEGNKLWNKVWQVACRAEEIPNVGDFVTYDILDESIIVVRNGPDRIEAFHNVCQHRARRLTSGCGNARQFVCPFHGWRWNLQGKNTFVLCREDYGDTLKDEDIALPSVRCEEWGGWVWITLDPDAAPLREYLWPAAPMLDAFELERMRYRWRQWLIFPCNWKVALEAFNESFHARISHPGLSEFGSVADYWCRGQGLHCWHGPEQQVGAATMSTSARPAPITPGSGIEVRRRLGLTMQRFMDEVNALTTRTIVDAAARLVDELPEGTPPGEVGAHLMRSAQADDAARGVHWAQVPPEVMLAAGHDWHLFPNTIMLQTRTHALCYRARPNGWNPDSCIFEAYVIELFPDGQAPETEWLFVPDWNDERWPKVLREDFQNMPEVQRGLKSSGFAMARPNPKQEATVSHFHETLARFMGRGAPVPIEPATG